MRRISSREKNLALGGALVVGLAVGADQLAHHDEPRSTPFVQEVSSPAATSAPDAGQDLFTDAGVVAEKIEDKEDKTVRSLLAELPRVFPGIITVEKGKLREVEQGLRVGDFFVWQRGATVLLGKDREVQVMNYRVEEMLDPDSIPAKTGVVLEFRTEDVDGKRTVFLSSGEKYTISNESEGGESYPLVDMALRSSDAVAAPMTALKELYTIQQESVAKIIVPEYNQYDQRIMAERQIAKVRQQIDFCHEHQLVLDTQAEASLQQQIASWESLIKNSDLPE